MLFTFAFAQCKFILTLNEGVLLKPTHFFRMILYINANPVSTLTIRDMFRRKIMGSKSRPVHSNVNHKVLLPSATKLGQGNIFRSVCPEFCPQGGVCPVACWDTHPEQTPRGADTPLSRHPPRTKHPPAQCMLGDTGNKRAVRILLECILVLLEGMEHIIHKLF